MKKAVVLLCVMVTVLFCFSACTGEGYPLKVDGSRISAGLYAYYLSETDSEDTAVDLCKQYIAAEKLMKDEGISLSANYKRLVAEETDSKWSLFSSYYEGIGVSKQDITAALTFGYNKKALLDYYYGEKGKKPVKDERLKEEFDKTYVGFKAIEASYVKLSDMGESVTLSGGEKKALKNRFSSMAKSINSGAITIDEANETYNESIGLIVTQNLETALMKQGNVLYGDNFFSEVVKLNKGEAAVIESGSSVYLLQRQNITREEDGYFFLYRGEILEKLKMSSVQEKLNKAAEGLDLKINKRLSREIADAVLV